MSKGEPVGPHVIKMIGYIKCLASLGMIMDNDLAINLVFQSLLNSYRTFITNYLISEKEKSLSELLGLPKTIE